jgi:zinc protease
LVTFGVAAIPPAGVAQTVQRPAQPAFAPTERIPFDPAVTTATLPNGLRYYIRRNARPEKRVMMQLAVKAGSVDEAEGQQGLAHFLEHMAFNGTKRFKAGELIAALESTGSRMGPHVNAYTSFDETVYMFQLPTDREGVVEKGMQALADFAGGMALDPQEIDKERGVVIEEWRGGLGVGARLRDQQIPILYHRSKYAERLPIGKPEVLKSFTPAQLESFYTRWYRPDRMAVVVVGDIEPERMVSLISREFGALPKPATPAPERNYDVPLPPEMLVKVATDPGRHSRPCRSSASGRASGTRPSGTTAPAWCEASSRRCSTSGSTRSRENRKRPFSARARSTAACRRRSGPSRSAPAWRTGRSSRGWPRSRSNPIG